MGSENQRETRRTVLAATGAAAVFGLAGCVTGDDSDDGPGSDAGDDGTDASGTDQTDGSERTVTLLVEGVGGHGDEHDDGEEHDHSETEGEHDGEGGHDDEQHGGGHDYGHEGLSSEELGHACNHMTEVEEFGAEDVEAGGAPEEAPHLSEVHHPYSVTLGGESGYVLFELGDRAHDHEGDGDGHSEDDHSDEEEHHEGDEHGHSEEEDGDEGEQEDDDSEMLAFFTQGGTPSVVEGELVYSETGGVDSCGPIDRYVIVEAHDGSAVVELTAGL